MYLIFPESMIIPEVADRREDDDFEDWLTAARYARSLVIRLGSKAISRALTIAEAVTRAGANRFTR